MEVDTQGRQPTVNPLALSCSARNDLWTPADGTTAAWRVREVFLKALEMQSSELWQNGLPKPYPGNMEEKREYLESLRVATAVE